jgi:hypothetical protein
VAALKNLRLKRPVYAVQHLDTGLYLSLCRRVVSLRPFHLATLFRSRDCAVAVAARRIPNVACEIARHDA